MDAQTRKRLIQEHLDKIREIEEQATPQAEPGWPPNRYYLLWHVVIGMMLGAFGAVVSLLANVFGAPLFGRRALDLIRVYLTFPMGVHALEVDTGVVLFVGCLLYLTTGALFGILIHLVMSLYFADAPPVKRFQVGTLLGIGLWIVNFYLILSWLQPLLLGDTWIVKMIPWWVGALTHLTFAWTVTAAEVWGRFEAYRGSD